jgi:amino acid transporter
MAEEIHQPERMIPLSILATVGIGLISSLGYSIAVFFSMTDLEGITGTPTGVPILELYHQATRSVAGAIVLQVLIVLTGLGCLTACRKFPQSALSQMCTCESFHIHTVRRYLASTPCVVICSRPRYARI